MDERLVAQAQNSMRHGRLAQALQELSAALTATTPTPLSLKLLARLALLQQQRPLAQAALNRALALLPDDAEVHALCAASAQMSGDSPALESSARRALAIDPGQPVAAALLVQYLAAQLRLSEAMQVADQCLARVPNDFGTRLARANLHLFCGDATAAERDAAVAVQASRSLQAKQTACLSLLYIDAAAPGDVLDRHLQLGRDIPPLPASMRARAPYRPGARPLRVGLLSPDLRRHPVGWFVEPLLLGWDRSRIVPVCYSDGAPDAVTARLRGHVAAWRDIRGETDAQVMQRIQDDAIDVLLDLSGHTHGSRPHLLASRSAPLQLSYLGYLFDTGLAGCDGIIGDALTLPHGTRSARRALRLPGSFLCYLPPAEAPPIAARATGATLTFGSFNHLAKLSAATVALWARVMAAVPHAQLVLCALGLADAGVRERTRARFVACGIAPDRLDLRPPITDLGGFLRQYDDIDIALDPLPFNGGTTTLQALWQGVPVLTWPGERMAARSGASILGAAGLSEFVAGGAGDFVAVAAALAQDTARRQTLRHTLRTRLVDAGLTDVQRFSRDFADLLETATSAPVPHAASG